MTAQHNITFKDALLYMPCALKKLLKCMEPEGDVAKGFFPYRFPTLDNVNYIGCIPHRDLFEIDQMNDGERREFEEWYGSFTNKDYDIKAECTTYCVQDVDILRRSLKNFRGIFIEKFQID